MAVSNEWFEYHLTPRGWVDGTAKMDHATEQQPVPPDRLVTVVFHEYIASPYSGMDLWKEETFRSTDLTAVEAALSKHGMSPHPRAELYR